MGEAREDAALAPEAFRGAGADLCGAQELDGCRAFEAAVAAARPPHAAHAAFADERLERVGAERLSRSRAEVDDRNGLFEEFAFAEQLVFVEQPAQFRGERGIVAGEPVEPWTALLQRHLECEIEMGAEHFPSLAAKTRHDPQYRPKQRRIRRPHRNLTRFSPYYYH